MKPIVEYQDYRRYMLDFYEERKRKSAFSWREFSKLAGFASSGYLKLVCDGKTRLSRVGAKRVACAMDLAGFHVDYFLLMVEFTDAIDDAKRKMAFEQMESLAKENRIRVLGADMFQYYGSWVNPVLRELAPILPGAKPLEMAKMFCSVVSAAEVRNSLDFMVRLGLLERVGENTYTQTGKGLSVGPETSEIASVAMRSMQKQMAKLAVDVVEEVPATERHVSGITFGLDRKTYEHLAEELDAFRRKVVSIISGVEDYDRVYRLNLQLFPLSRKKEENEEV